MLGVDYSTGKGIADFFRSHYGGGEKALFSGKLHEHFPQYGVYEPNFSILYDEMCQLDPAGYFAPDEEVLDTLSAIRRQGVRAAAITSTPEGLSRQILALAGIDPDIQFDLYYPYTAYAGPPKMVRGEAIFADVAAYFGTDPAKCSVLEIRILTI